MDTTEIIQILTAIVLFLTLRETIKQRRAQYQPTIKLSSDNFKLEWFGKDDKYLALQWVNKFGSQKILNFNIHKNLSYRNIGLGTAKNVKFRWHYDLNQFLKAIQKLSTGIEIKKKKHFISIKYFWFKSTINLKNDLEYNVEYLLPVDINEKIHYLNIPKSYLILLSIYIDLIIKNEKEKEFKKISMGVTISYHDIGNKKVSERYRIEPVLITTSSNDNRREEAATGQFVVEPNSSFFG